jgi:hypothetical protein
MLALLDSNDLNLLRRDTVRHNFRSAETVILLSFLFCQVIHQVIHASKNQSVCTCSILGL